MIDQTIAIWEQNIALNRIRGTAMHYHIDFEPVGRRGDCPAGQTLLDSARQLGVDLVNLCGGAGTCGRCKVQVLNGPISELSEREDRFFSSDELAAGYRLACRAVPEGDCKVRVPSDSLSTIQRTQVEGLEVPVTPEPPVRVYTVSLTPSSLEDLRADADRLMEALAEQHGISVALVDLAVLQQLSGRLRDRDWQLRVAVRAEEIVALLEPEQRALGLAIDLGTTKIAGYLMDLESGRTLSAEGIMNPQIAYGEDLIARMAYAFKGADQAAHMQSLVVESLNALVADLCAQAGAEFTDVMEAVLVANTAMHHLLLRLPVKQLANAPYVPAIARALDIKAREIGLKISPGGYLHLLPNIAGYVGADHVAMVLATGVHQEEEGAVLALDIGTNTEVCLAHDGSLTSLSCASGPAFEGAHIKHGMRAANGAIERVRMVDGIVEFQTIGDAAPVGICGSGILDTLAELVTDGVVSENGRMNEQDPRVRGEGAEREFILVPEDDGRPAVTFTQKDVRELQLAKGAIRTGVDVLLESRNLEPGQIDRVIIAGAFGSYIDVASAIGIGMLPEIELDRFSQVGNAAGMGAKLALISMSKRMDAQALAEEVRYIELAVAPNFSNIFARSMYVR